MPVSSTPPARQLTDDEWKAQASFANERDVGDRLQSAARRKLQALRDELAELRALARIPTEKAAEVREKRDKVTIRLQRVERDMGPNHPLTRAERDVYDRLDAELKIIYGEQARRTEAISPLGNLLRSVEEYVARVPPGVAMAPEVTPKLPKGISIAAIEQTRARIESLQHEIQAAIDAPVTSAEAKAKARAQVAALAERGTPNAKNAVDFGEMIAFGETKATVWTHEGKRAHADVPDAIGLIAALFRDHLIALMDAQIDAVSDDSAALSASERKQRIAAAQGALLAAEREECALVDLCKASGITVSRRPGTDPRALLQLADSAPAPNRE